MARKIYRINGFPTDGKFWRVEWFGGVSYNPQVPSEPLIEVTLARLPDGERNPLNQRSLTAPDRRMVQIGVGLLPYVPIASVWQDERLVPINFERHSYSLPVDTSSAKLIRLGDLVMEHGVIPRSQYLFGRYWPQLSQSFVVALQLKDDPFGVIIPVSELIRFYYAPSTRLAQALFWGEYHNCYNKEKCGFVEEGLYKIHLRKWMADADAWTLARFVLSERMQEQVRNAYKDLRKYTVSEIQVMPEPFRALRCDFPFSGTTTLKCISVHLPGPTHEYPRFLALRLLRCTAPFPFDNLVIDRDNSNLRGKNAGELNLPRSWKKAMRKEQKEKEAESQKDKFFADQEPQKSVEPLKVPVIEDRFAHLDGKKPIKEEKEVQQYRNAPLAGGTNPPIDGLGTGEGMWGESTLRPATINTVRSEDSERPPTLPASLSTFFDAMLHFQATSGYSVRYLASLDLEEDEVIFSEDPACLTFPAFDPYKGKEIHWSTLKASDGLRKRQVAVAEVSISDQICYVLEIERATQSFAILIMARGDFGEIYAAEWQAFLLGCAIKGRWMSEGEMREYHRSTTTHHWVSSVEVLGGRIQRKLERMVAQTEAVEPIQEAPPPSQSDVHTAEPEFVSAVGSRLIVRAQ